ncbi:hypothetical protein HPB52_024824 [Rhipicephalus sanguineus]|uniref:Uncharacterized protein n=1 Tax=Rhipicephalus sanguineus TaxID=34632 RepID=A0A9D4TDU6_RHISA|nr:hypothetical protein HPB52_024824 [Rhipicephalus sanguineus]
MAYQVHGEDIQRKILVKNKVGSPRARRAGAKTRTADSNEPSPQPGSRRGKLGGAAQSQGATGGKDAPTSSR